MPYQFGGTIVLKKSKGPAVALTGAVILSALVTMLAVPTAAQSTGAMSADAAAMKAIDSDCLAIHEATMALHPIHLELLASKWKVLSDADFAVAERTRTSITLVDVWKQGKNPAWVHAHTFTQSGDQRATQLCFRQKDGTLQRAKQATTLANIDGASAKIAYYTSSGKVILKAAAFEENDPMLAKTVANLPFYKDLP